MEIIPGSEHDNGSDLRSRVFAALERRGAHRYQSADELTRNLLVRDETFRDKTREELLPVVLAWLFLQNK